MLLELQKQLAPVKRRLSLRRAIAALAGGLVIGGWAALMAALIALFGGSTFAAIFAIVAAIGVPLVFAIVPMFRGTSWREAARAVDRRFQLHNRTSTALYLAEHPTGDSLESLQLEDAAAHLRDKKLRDAVTLRVPWQRLASGLLLTLVALGLVAWSWVMPMTGLIRVAPTARSGVWQSVADRKPVPLPQVDDRVAARSFQLLPTPDAQASPAPPAQLGVDVAGRYFDEQQKNAASTPR
jgi:hypothetical protein